MTEPTLYILMRSDMLSLNPGKAMAQAAHAANQFASVARTIKEDGFQDWENQTDAAFGTTIVLDAGGEEELFTAVEAAQDAGYLADIVLDPTYPVRDGGVTHVLPVVTCGYAFTPCRVTVPVPSLSEMTLHP